MSQTGIVTTAEGLNVRGGPGTEHAILGVLDRDERVALISAIGEWWGVETRFGLGFVHGAFITVSTDPEPDPGGGEPDEEDSYTCVQGDTLFGICRRFSLELAAVAALNSLFPPFPIQVGQVLRLPRGGVRPVTTTISILNPLDFAGDTEVTSSSLQGHHTPFLGACSCDLDIRGAGSPGTPVRFGIAGPAGVELRGVVREVGFACRSLVLADGGRQVKLAIQTRQAGGDWSDAGAWVLYAHLDPVTVGVGEVVPAGGIVGALGPSSGPEYHSSCAQGSHVHVEATRARCVVNHRAVIRQDAIMTLDA